MKIEVRLYGQLRQHRPADAPGLPHRPFLLTMSAGHTIADLAAQLMLPDGLVNAAACNGETVTLETVLQDGDSVSLFPPVSGGCIGQTAVCLL